MPDPWADTQNKAPASPPPSTPQPTAPESPVPVESGDPLATEMQQPISEEEAAEGGFGVFLKQQATSVTPASEQTSQAPVEAESASPDSHQEEPPAAVGNDPVTTTPELPFESAESDTESVEPPSEKTTEEDKPKSYLLSRRPQPNAPPPTPAPAPMSASTLQKMKSEGMYRNQYFKDAECFECGHKFKVSRSARSTTCPNCSANIPLDDVEVNMHSGESIRTRGDVLIRKRGQVSAEIIQCKDLRCQGILEANVKASGDAIFRATGTMIGEVHCRRFIIEKGADVVFLNEIHAEEVEVQARVTATIFSSGPLVIGTNGSVNGDVTARSVSIEPGGELNGAMNIVRTQATPRPTIEGQS